MYMGFHLDYYCIMSRKKHQDDITGHWWTLVDNFMLVLSILTRKVSQTLKVHSHVYGILA